MGFGAPPNTAYYSPLDFIVPTACDTRVYQPVILESVLLFPNQPCPAREMFYSKFFIQGEKTPPSLTEPGLYTDSRGLHVLQ